MQRNWDHGGTRDTEGQTEINWNWNEWGEEQRVWKCIWSMCMIYIKEFFFLQNMFYLQQICSKTWLKNNIPTKGMFKKVLEVDMD